MLLDARADRRSHEPPAIHLHARDRSVRLKGDQCVTGSFGGAAILQAFSGYAKRSRRRSAVEPAVGQLLGGLGDSRCRCRLGAWCPTAEKRESHGELVSESHFHRISRPAEREDEPLDELEARCLARAKVVDRGPERRYVSGPADAAQVVPQSSALVPSGR
ncbi:MAG: hypothetical protein KF850_28455 [Labilithrix sp.]|nr:hypothetical protein [Labilithrix sp.]MBX3216005.1 hypothetical protein [Labilithrix sp.]